MLREASECVSTPMFMRDGPSLVLWLFIKDYSSNSAPPNQVLWLTFEGMQTILLKEPPATHVAVGHCDHAVLDGKPFYQISLRVLGAFRQGVESSLPDSLNCGS